tara:strand:+ start:25 stop:429 length:405 start_codon:yes stop_codon:yes gene_type:complete
MIINKMSSLLAEADYRTEASFPLLSKTEDGDSSYAQQVIPSFADLKATYGKKWAKEKLEFQTQLKCNFFQKVECFASGQQELFMLAVPERKEKLYIQAFLDLFPSQYQPHVGDVERLASKRTRRLFVTLPNSYE